MGFAAWWWSEYAVEDFIMGKKLEGAVYASRVLGGYLRRAGGALWGGLKHSPMDNFLRRKDIARNDSPIPPCGKSPTAGPCTFPPPKPKPPAKSATILSNRKECDRINLSTEGPDDA